MSGSHPAGVRGLKLKEIEGLDVDVIVAPCRGAWIETQELTGQESGLVSRTPQGCVD